MEYDFLKAQYILKAHFYFFLATRVNVFFFIICFFALDTMNFFVVYPVGALLLYRFVFRKTKLDNPYKIGFMQDVHNLWKKIRSKL